MNKLQVELLNVLKEFISFCEKNNLQYFADGGTLLGAIRHEGFIPWDDDVDVCMPRNDYNKFIELYKSEDYFLQTPETDATYSIPFCKLRKNNSNLILEDVNSTNSHTGPFIDVYALDSIPDNPEVYSSLKGFIRTIRKYNWGTSSNGFRYLNELLTASTNHYENSEYVLPIVFASYSKFEDIKIPRKCYNITIYRKFEDIQIAVPCWYDEVLTCWYGDWKIEKRTDEMHAKVKEKEK